MKGLTALLIMLSSLHTGSAMAVQTSTIGKTFSISEPDGLQEIEDRAETVDWQAAVSKGFQNPSAARPEPVEFATENKTRYHVPWYRAEFDVKDRDGTVVYPKGYQFNPLEYVTLPQRLVFIAEPHAKWAQERLDPTDMVIISSGDYRDIAVELSRPVFVLDSRLKQRLNVQAVPSIITQEGSTLRIDEFAVQIE